MKKISKKEAKELREIVFKEIQEEFRKKYESRNFVVFWEQNEDRLIEFLGVTTDEYIEMKIDYYYSKKYNDVCENRIIFLKKEMKYLDDIIKGVPTRYEYSEETIKKLPFGKLKKILVNNNMYDENEENSIVNMKNKVINNFPKSEDGCRIVIYW